MLTPIDNGSLDNKYELIHEIKRGGFGVVYYGLDKRLNKPIAIKKIAPNLVGEEDFITMFHEEALNVARLNHNNIVHIYDLKKTHQGHLYIIMEYIDGYDLERIIRYTRKSGQKIPPFLAAHIVSEICVALDYANQRRDTLTNKPLNLVHQDVSPSNVMVSRTGSVKLIDFGISSVKLHQKTEKKSNKLRGKIPYMAPEQLMRGNTPDHRSDLFSLGLVLHEALAGERIFNSREDVYAAGKNPKAFKKAVDLSSFPRPLGKIVARALETDIIKRYQTANEMQRDLLQYLGTRKDTGELIDSLAKFVQVNVDIPRRRTTNNPTSKITKTEAGNSNSPTNQSTANKTTNKWNEVEVLEKAHPESDHPARYENISTQETFSRTDSALCENKSIFKRLSILGKSAKNPKNKILQILVGLLLIVFLIGIFAAITGWSSAGRWVRDLLLSQSIEIVTVPGDARFYLNGKKIKDQSPLTISDIPPGAHILEIKHSDYHSMTKSIFVSQDGAIQIKSENGQDSDGYLFRFASEITINSNPPGATVYINGTRLTRKTPCTINWKVGNPFSLALAHNGFEKLTGFSLNTSNGVQKVVNREFWNLQVRKDQHTQYAIQGTLRKRISFETTPSNVDIFDLNTNRQIATSGNGNSIFLTAGRHDLELRKTNFISQRLRLNIDENTGHRITAVLSRKVRFRATDALNAAEIGANLISLKTGNSEFLKSSKKTPLELTLPAYSYTAVFSRPGYSRTRVTFGPDTRDVRVVMRAAKAVVDVKVLDALSGQPIAGAEIHYHAGENPENLWSFFDTSNNRGGGVGELSAGKYMFSVQYPGFRPMTRALIARAGETHNLIFKIYPN